MEESSLGLILILAVLLSLAVLPFILLVIFRSVSERRKNRLLAEIAESLESALFGNTWCFGRDGCSFEYRVDRGGFSLRAIQKGRSAGHYLEVSMRCNPLFDFTIRTRKFSDRIWLGRVDNVYAGRVSEKGRSLAVVVDNRSLAAKIFGQKECRQAIDDLLDAGFNILLCSGGKLTAVKHLRNFELLDASIVAAVATRLRIISGGISTETDGTHPKPGIHRGLLLLAVLFVAALGGGIYASLSFDVMDLESLGALSFAFSIPAALAVCILYARTLIGMRPGSEASARRSVGATVLGLAFILAFVISGAALAANCAFDQSPHRIVTAPIVGKNDVSPVFNSYSLMVQSWREGRAVESVRVSEEDWEFAGVDSDCVSLLLRDGLFGFPWVESYSLVSGRLDAACASQQEPEVEEPLPVSLLTSPGISAAMNLSEEEEARLRSDKGLKARFDSYYEKVIGDVLGRWKWQPSESSFETTVEVGINSKGVLTDVKVVQDSGNAGFDSEALKALKEEGHLPPPSRELFPFFEEIRFIFHAAMPVENGEE